MTERGSSPLPISAVILTFNEEKNLPKCLDSIQGHVSEIIVVDSYSTDATVDIARKRANALVQHEYAGHPQQWQWTLDNVAVANDWIFAIDADFVVTQGVWDELASRLATDGASGYYVRHREIFRGRPISHGGVYPNRWLRVFRKDKVRIDLNELVDIHFFVDGPVRSIERDVEEQNYKDDDIFFWIQKQNVFAKRQAIEELRRNDGAATAPVQARFFGSPDQRKLFLKEIWYRLPLYVRPFAYFFYRYFLRLGFLDGKQGFVYHYTQGFLYRLLVDINIDQLRQEAKGIRD